MEDIIAYFTIHWYAMLIIPILTISVYVWGRKKRKAREYRLRNWELFLSPKLRAAYELVKDEYDFSTCYIISGTLLLPDWWGTYKDLGEHGLISISDKFIEWAPIEKIACVLVHELGHHQGMSEAGATQYGKDCYKKYGKE